MLKTQASSGEKLLASDEIAGILKISLNTVHNSQWQRKNGCPLIKIGKRTYTVESAFWNWIRQKGMLAGTAN